MQHGEVAELTCHMGGNQCLGTEIDESRIHFSVSKDFENCLTGIGSWSGFDSRYLKMRGLWDLQNHLQEGLPQEGVSSSEMEAILLCILSFPSVCLDVNDGTGDFEIPGSREQNGCCVISICNGSE